MRLNLLICLLGAGFTLVLHAQGKKNVNYDESKVGNIAIPNPLKCDDGSIVSTSDEWMKKRRPEVLRAFESEVYGKTPDTKLPGIRFNVLSEDKKALNGKATKREVAIHYTEKESPGAEILIYLPNQHEKPVPVFVSLNFGGNHSVAHDPAIHLSQKWFRNDQKTGYIENKATEPTRGSSDRRWPVEQIIARGYGVATAYYGDFEPDSPEGIGDGVRPLFFKPGQSAPANDDWAAIGAWAWGLSRMADYLETLPEVDAKKFAVLGHSRLGKTSLWAGAQDPRFTIVISNDSGAGGAALSKRIFGETAGVLNNAFPHWFCGNFKKYSENEAALPVDQHELIALMAPRPVYIASASEDLWADPKGEFLGGKLAEPVYALFGKKGLGASEPPPPDQSIG
ncbi:MAG TPA: acetylxylan esterase, partial [Verrucomicrobiaceae bacterium]